MRPRLRLFSRRLAGLLLTACCLTAAPGPRAVSQPFWLSPDRPTTQNLKAVFFTDSLHGWVGGDSGIILSTRDGGSSWEVLRGADSVSITDIFMLDSLRGWATAIRPLVLPGDWNGSLLYRTSDGGASWTGQSYPGQFFNTLFFFDSLEGCVGGELGLILLTTDGGTSWSVPSIDSTVYSSFPVRRVRFYSRDYGYAVGGYPESAGVIWKTTNGGGHWTVTGIGDALRGIHFVDSTNVLLLGGGFDDGACLTRTTDAGTSWSFSYVGPFGYGTSVAFRNPAEGWVPLGFARTSMFTEDTGSTWTEYQNPGGIATYGVFFTGDRHGYMVGDSGSVFRYNPPAFVNVAAQWNIVSVPVGIGQARKDSIFPTATSAAFRYTDGGYVAEETLSVGRGYWMKFPSPAQIQMSGLPLLSDTIPVAEGWNMVGSISTPVEAASVTTNPPGILISNFFEFGNGYTVALQIMPGKGYWVRVGSAGVLVLTAVPE